MPSTDVELTELAVPGAYVEDVRSALVAAINADSDSLSWALARRDEDQDSRVHILGRNLRLLEQLSGAEGDTTLVAPAADKLSDPLGEALQATVRVLSARLEDVCQYEPVPMGDVREIAAELCWAADGGDPDRPVPPVLRQAVA